MRRMGKTGAVFLVMLLFVTGCVSPAGQQVPELQEPVSRNSSSLPVELGRIGDVEVLLATVVSAEYPHFYQSGVTVEKIVVEAGDYVEKGDILAYAGTREDEKRKKELKEELVQEQKKSVWQEKIAEQKEKELRLSGEKNVKKQLAILRENIRYEKELCEQRLKELKEEIKDEEQKIQTGMLRAKHNGYVTYRKDLTVSAETAAFENVVVIADREQQYLEVTDQTIEKYGYKGYEVKYIISGRKQYDVKEISYTEQEMLAAKKGSSYPAVRFSCPTKAGLATGDSCLIYFCKKSSPEVLVVGNDSLYTQGGEYFVYVKKADGEEEKRMVEIGEQDEHRTEIKSGLEEGELVSYTSAAVLPADYNSYTVERAEYEVRSHNGSCRFADAASYVVTSELGGIVVENNVSDGDRIKKGDLLYVVDTGKTKAVLADLSNQILSEKESYRDTVRAMEEQAATELKGKKGGYRAVVKKRLQYEKELAEYTYTYTIQQMEKKYNEYMEGNDGDGKVSVYAEYSGSAVNCQINVGERITVGTYMLAIERVDKSRLLLLQIPPLGGQLEVEKRIANVGEMVTFSSPEGEYSEICTGYTGGGNKIYLSTEDGKGYLSQNSASSFEYPGYYVEIDKERLPYQLPAETLVTFAVVHLKDVLMVPVNCVHKENSGGSRSDWYVWRVVQDQMVKQYVTLDEELNDGVDQVIFSGLEPGDVIAS